MPLGCFSVLQCFSTAQIWFACNGTICFGIFKCSWYTDTVKTVNTSWIASYISDYMHENKRISMYSSILSISTLANTNSTCSFSQYEHQILVLCCGFVFLEEFKLSWCNRSRPFGAPIGVKETKLFNSSLTSCLLELWPVMDSVSCGWSHTSQSVWERVSLPTFGREWG